MRLLPRRRVHRLRFLGEAECYARCHGERKTEVRIVRKLERRRRFWQTSVSGEHLRRCFEDRLDSRDPAEA
jgi:hypothetical protein